MATKIEATIDDLYHTPDGAKAEIVNGELVVMSPTGRMPNYAATTIVLSLHTYCRKTRRGIAVSDNAGFAVDLPHRKSFSPDAAYYDGPNSGMKFFQGAPQFAVEVRSEGDYGKSAERELAAKLADYFAAGTLVVWDVDLLSADVVRAYAAAQPEVPQIFHRDEIASAEPAVPGWSLPVNELFEA